MAIDLSPYLAAGYASGQTAADFCYAAELALQAVGDELVMGDMADARTFLYQAGLHIRQAGNAFGSQMPLYDSLNLNWYSALGILQTKSIQIDSITLRLILDLFGKATFDELQEFIALVDAYRSAVLPAPYNADYYAGFVRKFAKWV